MISLLSQHRATPPTPATATPPTTAVMSRTTLFRPFCLFHWVFLLLPRQVSVLQCPAHGGTGVRDFYTVLDAVCPVGLASHGASSQESITGTAPRHVVDLVFLIEYSPSINTSYLDHFTSSLKNLSSMFETHTSADTRFTVLIYSLEQDPPTLLHIKHSHYIHSRYNLREEVRRVADGHTNHTVQLSITEMGYRAVDGALYMLNTVLSGVTMTDTTGQSHSVKFRPQSNAHIAVGLGLFDKTRHSSAPTYSNATVTARIASIDRNMDFILGHSLANTSLHFFLSPGIVPASEFVGSSFHEVRYRDCTHLNRALTLQALLAETGESGSLQAHLLARGRDIHIMDLPALERVDCIRAMCPILWGGSELTHIHQCRDGREEECVSTGGYCSPLHGCVADSPVISSTDDRVPLTGQLVMSHADLAKSVASSNVSYSLVDETEELSISKSPDSSAPAFSLTDVVTGEPHTLRVTPHTEFAERVINDGRPVVIKNSVVSLWSAMEKWDFSYLVHNMGTDTLARVKCTDSYLTFDPDRTAPLKLSISLPFTEKNMSTSSFFSCVQQPSPCPDGFLGHYYFGSVPTPLQADLNPTGPLYRTEKDYKAGRQFVWISSAGMITHAHFDQDHNFFVQLRGKKRFTLWSPAQHELLYMYPRVHPLWHKSRINFRSPDLTRFPDFSKSRALQVVLGPGDVLYVPPYTWHYVETLSPSVSLSTWSHDYDMYDHMNAIYRHDHKFDLIKDPRGILASIITQSFFGLPFCVVCNY